jgi:prevent-host-death family protein
MLQSEILLPEVDNQTRPDYILIHHGGNDMQITNISDAKASLSKLIKMVQETNEPIIIGKAGEPVAILSAYRKEDLPRQLGGSWEGQVKISEDFDETDEETVAGFYNSPLLPENS